MLSLLSWIRPLRLRASKAGRLRARPWLVALEERTLLNNRFVVPAVEADNVTRFTTLSAALTTPGLASGNIIQIEPGSSFGDVSATTGLPACFSSLTIQGDPAVPRSDSPGFTISGAFDLTASQSNFTLSKVNFTLTGSGELTFPANASILNSSITDDSSRANGITLSGSQNVIAASTLTANNSCLVNVVPLQPPAGATDSITGNTFEVISGVGQGGGLVSFQLTESSVAVTDQVSNNNFLDAGGPRLVGVHVLSPTAATSVLTGLRVVSNNFTDPFVDIDADFHSQQSRPAPTGQIAGEYC
jgi:hypothetical protein